MINGNCPLTSKSRMPKDDVGTTVLGGGTQLPGGNCALWGQVFEDMHQALLRISNYSLG